MKKIFSATKYLWLGGVIGLLQQLFGDLDGILYHGGQTFFRFSGMLSTLTIYAGIILLIIKRDAPPKHQFRDVLLFFVGLDIFYYLYASVGIFVNSVLLNPYPMSNEEIMRVVSGILLGFITNFAYWTAIGLAAAIWACIATKLRNSGKKKLYITMLIPLFAVIVIELIYFVCFVVMFVITEYKIAHNLLPAENAIDFGISNLLSSIAMLVFCLYKYLKQPAEKNDTQES